MEKYQITVNEYGTVCITKFNDDDTITIFLADEQNPDYQQYLIDTDGGLPIPTQEEAN